MRLTPLDIKRQQFKKSMRGYDTAEVDIFLEMLSSEYENLVQQNTSLIDRVSEMETQLREYRQMERSLQQTLVQAQETAAKTIESAKRDAGAITKEAELRAAQALDKVQLEAGTLRQDAEFEAARIIENAQRDAENARNELGFIQSQKESLLNKMRTLLSSQLETLKSLGQEGASRATQPEVTPEAAKEEPCIVRQQVEPVKVEEPVPKRELGPESPPLSEPMKKDTPRSTLEIDEIVKRLDQTFKLLDNPTQE